MVSKMNWTLSKVFAFVALIIGSVLSWLTKNSEYFTSAMTFAGLVFISKNAEQAYKKGCGND